MFTSFNLDINFHIKYIPVYFKEKRTVMIDKPLCNVSLNWLLIFRLYGVLRYCLVSVTKQVVSVSSPCQDGDKYEIDRCCSLL